jgi:hypothetical protein
MYVAIIHCTLNLQILNIDQKAGEAECCYSSLRREKSLKIAVVFMYGDWWIPSPPPPAGVSRRKR